MRRPFGPFLHAPALVLITAMAFAALPEDASARGFLGLFANEQEPIVPSAPPTVPVTVDVVQGQLEIVAFIAGLRDVNDPQARLYEFVREDTVFDLGKRGELTLTFIDPCHEEVAIGGKVTVTRTTVKLEEGRLENRAASCRPLHELLPNLVPAPPPPVPPSTLFDPARWREIVINGASPIFRWQAPETGDLTKVRVLDLDQPEPAPLWEAETPFSSAVYPVDAPELVEGHPYRVVVELPDGQTLSETFSVDLRLSYTNTPLNTLVVPRATPGSTRR